MNRWLAYLVLRLALGINIFVHGLTRLLGDYSGFADEMIKIFSATFLPVWSVSMLAHLIPIVEFVVGALLMAGLFTQWTALIGSLLMLILIFGSSLVQKWDIVGIQMIYVLFYFLILFLSDQNRFSLDAKMK